MSAQASEALRGIATAKARSARVDALIGELAHRLPPRAAVVALGAYGRAQLTPHSEVELLFLHHGELSSAEATQAICYPLWEHGVHVEPFVRTLDECTTDARRSWSALSRFLDARYLAGDRTPF